MLYQRQGSRINVMLTMDDDITAQVVPTCVYDTIDSGALMSTSSPSTDATFGNNATPTLYNAQQTMACGPCETDILFDFTGATGSIAEAAKRALIEGNVTPLVKEELKYAIQSKRLKEGKTEMKVEFTSPAPDILTAEEEEKVEKRRVQNREAAQRFRERQKSRVSSLTKKCHNLETKQTQLLYELEQVRRERDELRAAFQQHMAICPLQLPVHVSQTTGNDT